MNFHIGDTPTGRLFSFRSTPRTDDASQIGEAAGHDPGAGFDSQEPSFFKKHSLLAAYIAFTVTLCAAISAVAIMAVHGLPSIAFGF